jgi:putative ABC transport system permease protein
VVRGAAGRDGGGGEWRGAWYRVRATWRARLAGLIGLALVIGLTGGIAMAAIAGARRTQSSYAVFLASTNPSALTFTVYDLAGNGPPTLLPRIRALPDVTAVKTLVVGLVAPLDHGAPNLTELSNDPLLGSTNGFLLSQDRPAVLAGRIYDPSRADEVLMTPAAEKAWHAQLGSHLTLGVYSPAQTSEPGFGSAAVRPTITQRVTVVGTVLPNTGLVQDDIDRAYGFVFLSPAFVRRAQVLGGGWRRPVYYAIKLVPGTPISRIEGQLNSLVPKDNTGQFHVASSIASKVSLALRPESIALGAFGAIAALVCLVLGIQALARQTRRDDLDRQTLRALGARPRGLLVQAALGPASAVVAGTAVALAVAVALSPLFPIGPVRPVYPSRGISLDATVLVGGTLVLLVVLGGGALALGAWSARRRRPTAAPASGVGRWAHAMGLSVSAATGVRFALEAPRARRDVPVRSVVAGAVVAVTLVVATATFSSSLNTLVATPSLYGWNWTYLLNPTNIVPNKVLPRLNRDPDVAAWSGVNYAEATIDGVSVPMLLAHLHATVLPPILTGHRPRTSSQIVLGAETLAALHVRVGQSVTVSYGTPQSAPNYLPPRPMTVVGTATFPAVGWETVVADHTSMGVGALIPWGFQSTAFLKATSAPTPLARGPSLVLVRLRQGVSSEAGRRNLESITAYANRLLASDPMTRGNAVYVLGVQRPAQIVDYRTIGDTPLLLAAGLAVGAVTGLALTLIASVRARRRDLAMLRAFGFTRRQLAATIAWQATTDAVVGLVFGVPLGILLGRQLWTLFARSIYAVPHPSVSTISIVTVVAGTLVVANLVATWPGRRAARTSPGVALRAE